MPGMTAAAPRPAAPGWRAELALGFQCRAGGTVLARRSHQGPLVVQKPFYPEGCETCHVYIVHPPGGVAGGDELDVRLELEPGARALITTPGAAKLYRSAGREAALRQRFRLAPGAVLEWMPQETIVHSGARAALETEIELDAGACFAGWEITCLGLPASGAPFETGRFLQGLRLTRRGEPLFQDRCLFQGGDPMLDAPWGMAGHTVHGLFLATCGPDQEPPVPQALGGASFGTADSLLVGRYLGRDAWEAKQAFIGAWALWRKRTLGREACLPRIWST